MRLSPVILLACAGLLGACRGPEAARAAASPAGVVVLAGGCYWGVESVFQHVRGVTSVTSGYAFPVPSSGSASTAPAESVRLVYDSTRITYRQILDIFFSVVHDPTQRDRQGPDVGRQYRSIVFVSDSARRGLVRAYIDSLGAARVYARPIVTEIAALQSFQPVPGSQQDYAERHPADPYIVRYDVPKVAELRTRFPGLYRE